MRLHQYTRYACSLVRLGCLPSPLSIFIIMSDFTEGFKTVFSDLTLPAFALYNIGARPHLQILASFSTQAQSAPYVSEYSPPLASVSVCSLANNGTNENDSRCGAGM